MGILESGRIKADVWAQASLKASQWYYGGAAICFDWPKEKARRRNSEDYTVFEDVPSSAFKAIVGKGEFELTRLAKNPDAPLRAKIRAALKAYGGRPFGGVGMEESAGKAFEMPKGKLDYIAKDPFFKRHYEMKDVPISRLVKDNDLDDPVSLSYHAEWSKGEDEDGYPIYDIGSFAYDPAKDSSDGDVIYGSERNGKLILANGRPRVKALANGGYETIRMPVLKESEGDFDWGTGEAKGDDIFDVSTLGGFSGIADTIPGAKYHQYMIDKKNKKGEIVQMTPQEFYDVSASFFRKTADELKSQRKSIPGYIDKLKAVITEKKRKFPLPFLDYTERSEEGLHRMYAAAELFGWDHKFPVLEVKWADQKRHDADVEARERKDAEDEIGGAISKTLRLVGLRSLGEFADELKDWLPAGAKVSFDEKADEFTVESGGYSVTQGLRQVKDRLKKDESLHRYWRYMSDAEFEAYRRGEEIKRPKDSRDGLTTAPQGSIFFLDEQIDARDDETRQRLRLTPFQAYDFLMGVASGDRLVCLESEKCLGRSAGVYHSFRKNAGELATMTVPERFAEGYSAKDFRLVSSYRIDWDGFSKKDLREGKAFRKASPLLESADPQEGDVYSALKKYFRTSKEPTEGASYLLRDGTFVDATHVTPALKALDLSEVGHESDKGIHLGVESALSAALGLKGYYGIMKTDEISALRLNTGAAHDGWSDRPYIDLSARQPTAEQRAGLVAWLQTLGREVTVETPDDKSQVAYDVYEAGPNHIADAVDSYYSTGRLIEEKKKEARPLPEAKASGHLDKEMIQAALKEFGTDGFSETQRSSYVLRDGSTISLAAHSDLAEFVEERFGVDDYSDLAGSKLMDRANAVRLDSAIPDVVLPRKDMTDAQYEAVERFVLSQEFAVAPGNPLEVMSFDAKAQASTEDLIETTAEDVMNAIRMYYITGRLSLA